MKKSDPKKGGGAGGAVEDLINYKGIYYEDDTKKYICPETGAHFEYLDMFRRLKKILVER